MTIAVSFTHHFLQWHLVYAYYLMLAILYNSKNKDKRAHQYDAFVSYNANDEGWVLGELLPKLEDEQGWRLCLHHRDFQPAVSFTHHFLQWHLVYAYYLMLAILYNSKNKDKRAHQYDAFVSYNANDEGWVLGELLPKLEDEQGWRLCLHHRDFQPGEESYPEHHFHLN
ncbi:unnamed protein product [Gadus morhua 'NCC']